MTTGPVFRPLNPPELGEPRGWSHGMLAPAGGAVLFVAGQTASDPEGRVPSQDFALQFDEALRRVLAVVAAAGAGPEAVGRMTVYVTDMDAYLADRGRLGELYRARMGRHYPAMALVAVERLVDPGALVEIEATAVVPPPRGRADAGSRAAAPEPGGGGPGPSAPPHAPGNHTEAQP